MAAEGHRDRRTVRGVPADGDLPRRARYGADGMIDEHRSGRPRQVDRSKIIAVTSAPPPKKLGITHWTSRLLAVHLKTSNSYPNQELHLVMDNYAAHKRVESKTWLAHNPRIHIHFTGPTRPSGPRPPNKS